MTCPCGLLRPSHSLIQLHLAYSSQVVNGEKLQTVTVQWVERNDEGGPQWSRSTFQLFSNGSVCGDHPKGRWEASLVRNSFPIPFLRT